MPPCPFADLAFLFDANDVILLEFGDKGTVFGRVLKNI